MALISHPGASSHSIMTRLCRRGSLIVTCSTPARDPQVKVAFCQPAVGALSPNRREVVVAPIRRTRLLHPCRSARHRPAHIEDGDPISLCSRYGLLWLASISLPQRGPLLFQVAFSFFLGSVFWSFPVLLRSSTC